MRYVFLLVRISLHIERLGVNKLLISNYTSMHRLYIIAFVFFEML